MLACAAPRAALLELHHARRMDGVSASLSDHTVCLSLQMLAMSEYEEVCFLLSYCSFSKGTQICIEHIFSALNVLKDYIRIFLFLEQAIYSLNI